VDAAKLRHTVYCVCRHLYHHHLHWHSALRVTGRVNRENDDPDPTINFQTFDSLLYGAVGLVGATLAVECWVGISREPGVPPQTLREYRFMSVCMGIFLALFLARAIWGVLFFIGLNPLQERLSVLSNPDSPDFDPDAYMKGYVTFYFVFEILPLFSLAVWIFYSSPHAQASRAKKHSRNRLAEAQSASDPNLDAVLNPGDVAGVAPSPILPATALTLTPEIPATPSGYFFYDDLGLPVDVAPAPVAAPALYNRAAARRAAAAHHAAARGVRGEPRVSR
jgi:hypothetical protein